MRRIVDLRPTDPRMGLALDEVLLESSRERREGSARLWVNGRAIVIGRAQGIRGEVDLDGARREGVPVLRRISGGGAVFHYPGNLNATLVVEEERSGSVGECFAEFGGTIARGLLGVGAEVGVRDHCLILEGRKAGGAAQARRGGWVLYHSTLLVRPPERAIERLLLAGRPGYRPSGVPSRPEATVTLSEALGRPVTVEEAATVLERSIAEALPSERGSLTEKELERARILAGTKYARASWNASR